MNEEIYDHELMTITEVCAFLKVHQTTIYRKLRKGKFPGAFRVGSDWRVRRTELLAHIAAGKDL